MCVKLHYLLSEIYEFCGRENLFEIEKKIIKKIEFVLLNLKVLPQPRGRRRCA